jgi:hypothetical protein
MNIYTEEEKWSEIEEVDKRYSVSSYGRFINNRTGKFCKSVLDQKGYLRIRLYYNKSEARTFKAHRLVAKYYVANPFNKPEVNHDDGNKQNNYYKNLKWSTGSENVKHAFDTGLKVNTVKQRQCAAKLLTGNSYSAKRIVDIVSGIEFSTVKEAAKSIGYSSSGLSNMLTGFRENHTNLRYKQI